MICRDLECVFVHIPKTGGQSVEAVLLDVQGLTSADRPRVGLAPNIDPAKGPPRLAHLTAEEYVRCHHLGPGEFARYFKFAFVRNPWSRIASEYAFRHARRLSFEEFLFEGFPTPEDDDHASGDDAYRHVLPQSEFLFDAAGAQLVDFVGRFERLAEDFAHVCERLGLPRRRLPHLNAGGRRLGRAWHALWGGAGRRYAGWYDARTRERVRSLYAADIERFGYGFDGV